MNKQEIKNKVELFSFDLIEVIEKRIKEDFDFGYSAKELGQIIRVYADLLEYGVDELYNVYAEREKRNER